MIIQAHATNSNNLDGAQRLVDQLLSTELDERELSFEVHMLHVDLLLRRQAYTVALAKIEELATMSREENRDISFRVRLLVQKAFVFEKCGRPQKGFSIAVRAASIAWQARLLPALWLSMGAISNILVQLKEFDAAAEILAAVLPQVEFLLPVSWRN
jgi:anaphase-promoting complex subunit 5